MLLNKLFIAAQNRYFLLKEEEEGQTMAEYGVVLAVITIGVVVALGFLSGKIQGALSTVGSKL
jgi:Flp pilus assembly pilin Flp